MAERSTARVTIFENHQKRNRAVIGQSGVQNTLTLDQVVIDSTVTVEKAG